MADHPADDRAPELADLLAVQPPAFLEAVVQARVAVVLAERRAEISAAAQDAPPAPAPAHIGAAEGWAYACGFLAYGAQLVDGLARLIWRAMAG